MAANIGDIRAKVKGVRVKDTSIQPLADADYDAATLSALNEYQRKRPRERVAQVTGTGSFDYQIDGGAPVLAGYLDGFSAVKEVWFPYLTTDQVPNALEPDEWCVIRTPSGLFLRFLADAPTSPDKFAATYTTPHTLDGSTSTIPTSDDEALADLSASYAFLMLASPAAGETSNAINADTMNRLTKVSEYKRLSQSYRDAYNEKLGVSSVQSAAQATIEVDRAFPPYGQDRLFHGKRFF